MTTPRRAMTLAATTPRRETQAWRTARHSTRGTWPRLTPRRRLEIS
ncbi:hypothetical protein KKB55_12060 [Myxococcota bacterium]|nr:hypothetical protein [Myxococcota bacterium]MBU1898474.1 hypothetical protein [Myxococcota bacterium]